MHAQMIAKHLISICRHQEWSCSYAVDIIIVIDIHVCITYTSNYEF